MRKEQIHYEAVIEADNQPEPTDYCISARADHWNGFVEGYLTVNTYSNKI